MIPLHNCDGFCQTSTWSRYRCTYVPSLLNLPPTSLSIPPLWVVTEHQLLVRCVTQQIPTGYLLSFHLSSWWKWNRRVKAGFKLNIQKMKIMASGPITSWQIDGEKMETVTEFIFLDSKSTADGDCSHEIKRRLLLGRKAMTNLDSILKSRDISLPRNVHVVKAMVFPVVMYGCESWTVKKAERWRIDAFELWCWRTLESPLDCKEIQLVHPKGNQSWIFIGRTDAKAEAPILWPPDGKNWLIGKAPDAGKD